jgi:hypothetical protein
MARISSADFVILEYYLQSTAALFAALSTYGSLVDPVVRHVLLAYVNLPPTNGSRRTHLVAGTTPSVLSSHSILALLTDDDLPASTVPAPFHSVLPSIARKVQESIGTEKPNIARPAREAKEILRKLDDSLFGS